MKNYQIEKFQEIVANVGKAFRDLQDRINHPYFDDPIDIPTYVKELEYKIYLLREEMDLVIGTLQYHNKESA